MMKTLRALFIFVLCGLLFIGCGYIQPESTKDIIEDEKPETLPEETEITSVQNEASTNAEVRNENNNIPIIKT